MSNLSTGVRTEHAAARAALLGPCLLTSVALSVAAFGRGSTGQNEDVRAAGHDAPALLPERPLTRICWGWR